MILVSLVGEQPIPNLIPLWQDRTIRAVRFAATGVTHPVADGLEQFVRTDPSLRHIEVLERIDLPAYQIGKARAALVEALAQTQSGGEAVCLNLTGGTKIMSLAALQAAYGTGVPLLYVSTEENQLIRLQSDGAESERLLLNVTVSVDQYLRAHGLEVSDNLGFHPEGPRSQVRPPMEGDWLEEQVFQMASHANLFDDVRRGVYIRKKVRDVWVTNELDVVVTRNGRMAVCSCKSGKVDKEDLYELSSLSRREAAGIYCGKLLICGQGDVDEAVKQRAGAFGIRLVYGDIQARCVDQILAALASPRSKEMKA